MDEREMTGANGKDGSEKNTVRRRRPETGEVGRSAAMGGAARTGRTGGERTAGNGRRTREGSQGRPERRSREGSQGRPERRSLEGSQGRPERSRTDAGEVRRARPRRPEGNPARPRREEGTARPRPAENAARRTRKSSKKKHTGLKVAVVLLLIVLLTAFAGGAFVWKKYGPTKEKYDLNTYFGIGTADQGGVTLNNEVMEAQNMRVDGKVYVTYEFVRDYLNDRFYWDTSQNALLYTLPAGILKVTADSMDYTVSQEIRSEDYVILRREENTAYIAMDFVQKFTNLEFTFYQNPNRLFIISEFGETKTAEVKKATPVRCLGGMRSPVLTELAKGAKVTLLDEAGDWKKVRTQEGFVGYIYQSRLTDEKVETTSREFTEDEYTSIHKDYTINLAWHQVTSEAANSGVQSVIASTRGLTTISPTWFTIADNSGNLTSIASADYVDYAHRMGIEVWALVDNFGENVDDLTLFRNMAARENLIKQLISESLRIGVDGINVDFEQIPMEAGEHYIQFIRELSLQCRQNNLVLSVDNYVPKGYNAHYHRTEQGVMADYVIIMGYDEHFGGSYEAGSVASYNYVKEGIEETLKEVPAEKVINAVPFYTRLWRETPKTEAELAEQAGTEAAEYPMKVTSEAIGMAEAASRVSAAGVTAVWDDTTKQNYASWTDSDGSTYKIWLEDASSLEAKLQLMKDNGLAGSAAWKLGFETADIWDLISQYVN